MNDQDKKELKQMIVETFNEGFEAIVLPHIERMEGDISQLKTDVAELKTDVKELKTDVAELKTGQQDLQTGQDAIAKRQEAEQIMLDEHDRLIEDLQGKQLHPVTS